MQTQQLNVLVPVGILERFDRELVRLHEATGVRQTKTGTVINLLREWTERAERREDPEAPR